MTPEQFVNNVSTKIITGYGDEPISKEDWLKAGRSILKKLAKELGLPDGSYEISINRAGPAVSGDIILHGQWLYINLSQTSISQSMGFYWRLCKGMKDYSGGINQWESWKALLDLHTLADKMAHYNQMFEAKFFVR